jgi:hypothetical protein
MASVPMKLEKAMLKRMPGGGAGGILDAIMGGAMDVGGLGGMVPTVWEDAEMHFKFNPTQLSESKSGEVSQHPTPSSEHGPQVQANGANARRLSFQLFIDEWEAPAGRDVTDMVAKLYKLLDPTPGSTPPSPPLVSFIWGKYRFNGLLHDVKATYSMFRRDGSAARAEVDISMVEHLEAPKATNPSSGGPANRRTRQLIDGENLQTIAFSEYGNPNDWRLIAGANGIDDPFRLSNGAHLLVPRADDVGATN